MNLCDCEEDDVNTVTDEKISFQKFISIHKLHVATNHQYKPLHDD